MISAAEETIYGNYFRENLSSRQNQPAWLRDLREKAFRFFTENGFPTPQNEEWKYTNVAPLAQENFVLPESSAAAGVLNSPDKILPFVFDESKESVLVFVNGRFDRNLSNLSALGGAQVLSFSEAANNENFSGIFKAKLASLVDFDKNGFTALNTAFIDEGAFLFVPKNTKVEAPVQFLFLTEDGKAAFPRVLIVAEAFAQATIIETYTRGEETKYLTDAVVEISLADEAKIEHYRVQRESHSAFHVGSSGAEIRRGAVYDATNITLGARLSRHDVSVKFLTTGGEAFVDGLYMVGGLQHADTHSVIDHQLPNCVSHQTYKGIVDGRARAVFNGKVFVRENASGTDAQQSNKNLLLSNEARVDTKPQLEIFNDDVKCSHGATVGQLEEEELFYLLSRGLNESLARNLLTYGFAEEIVNKIGIATIKKQLDEAVLNRLH
ncbi:MAG TPA: Fe-S cluster assembly protein SufD, partial [Pyrinomonadaceae bacterium]|nr:Fe-S cluster assembly protein SufD [Pyrinomonadaceae bacterium]